MGCTERFLVVEGGAKNHSIRIPICIRVFKGVYVETILIYHETAFTISRFDMSPGFRKDMFDA